MIGIVGAGITGLAAHHYLTERGVPSVVFEATAEPGGMLRTIEVDGKVLECGPQRMRFTPPLRELVATAGIEEAVLEAADVPLYIYHAGRLRRVPLSVTEAISTDLLSWRGKLRVLLEPVVGVRPRADETVLDYMTRTFGPEFARRIGGPLYAGLYASDPAEMPVTHSLARALERFEVGRSVLLTLLGSRIRGRSPSSVVSFSDGMQMLPRALADRYGTGIQRAVPVRWIDATPAGFDIRTDDGATAVNDVILTTPAAITAELIDDIDADVARALDQLTYNPLVLVHLFAETSLVGSGHQIAYGEEYVTRGVTWNDSLFPDEDGRDGIYTCFLGGASRPEVMEWDDDRLGTVAATEFESMTGFEAEPINVCRLPAAMPAYDHTWEALRGLELPEGIHLCANYIDRAGIPGRVVHARRVADQIARAG